jgi:hypothetical protein
MELREETSTQNALVYPEDIKVDWAPGDAWYDYQLQDNGGLGLLTQYGARNQTNPYAMEFMTYQIKERLIPGLEVEEDLLDWAWDFAFYAVDQIDPYMFFHGYTDVVKTNEPMYYQFSVREDLDDEFREIGCDAAEFFKIFPEGAMKNFRYLYNDIDEKKGLLKNFDIVHDYFHDHLSMIEDEMHESYYDDEIKFFRRYGKENAMYVMERAVWAALIWMISPEHDSRTWRYDFHPIFQIVYDHKACLLNDWTFYRPGYFMMDERPLGSCAKCGTTEWCVELTHGKHKTEYICQSCASDGEPFPGFTCGTKTCTSIECKNHPAHEHANTLKGTRKIREIEADARYGPLRQLPNGMKTRELPGIIYINQYAIEKTTRSIADQVGNAFTALLEDSFSDKPEDRRDENYGYYDRDEGDSLLDEWL